ncbi:hypothetical protein KRP22_014808 [Phytophthora ramorum]|nr:hypothetical protein KRP22_14138 [Phytophthora ramorum]
MRKPWGPKLARSGSGPTVNWEAGSSLNQILTDPATPQSTTKKKKSKAVRKKLKAPESDAEDRGASALLWNEDSLEYAYHRKNLGEFLRRDPMMKILIPKQIGVLKGPVSVPRVRSNKLDAVKEQFRLLDDSGLVAGAFEANELFDLDLDTIHYANRGLFDCLKLLVGESPQIQDPEPSPQVSTAECQTGSSHYASATSEPDSDSSADPRRMPLGPSGMALIGSRAKVADIKPLDPRDQPTASAIPISKPRSRNEPRMPVATIAAQSPWTKPTMPAATIPITSATDPTTSSLESYFQAAMSRFLKEQQVINPPRVPAEPKYEDVDMESVGSHHPSPWDYDPDDLEAPRSGRVTVATAAAGSNGTSMIQRVRISAISDLKEFLGKDQDEDRARSWISKVKSAFLRDQASDEEKCLTFADLLAGPAKNWYRQLSRTTRSKWSDLLRCFQVQYCGLGVSVAWQYYHARKRSDESPLEYLHRLNVAALRTRLKIKDGEPKDRREHVDHFIETLGDQDLADQLTLLRLPDADALEEVLRARERAKSRQKRSAFGSKYRQKAAATAPTAPAKRAVHAIQIQGSDPESDLGSEGSDAEGDLRRIYLASGEEKSREVTNAPPPTDPLRTNSNSPEKSPRDPRSQGRFDGSDHNRCSHCGSRKHTDLGCWRRLTCQKCGKRGHPADHCLFVCRGCGELHDMGKCPMEEFYNQIRQWYNPTKHAGMLPAMAEKMLN